jgi:hypothetical protein
VSASCLKRPSGRRKSRRRYTCPAGFQATARVIVSTEGLSNSALLSPLNSRADISNCAPCKGFQPKRWVCWWQLLLSAQAGFRIEHPQSLIDRIQYRQWAEAVDRGRGKVPVADYTLAAQERGDARSCFSFCMCPGGQVSMLLDILWCFITERTGFNTIAWCVQPYLLGLVQ